MKKSDFAAAGMSHAPSEAQGQLEGGFPVNPQFIHKGIDHGLGAVGGLAGHGGGGEFGFVHFKAPSYFWMATGYTLQATSLAAPEAYRSFYRVK